MCYGHCSFEDSMGECRLVSHTIEIKETLKLDPCFVGGMVTCPEDDAEFAKLLTQGKIKEMQNQVWEWLEKYWNTI